MILNIGYSDVHVLNTLEFVGVKTTYWMLEYSWIFGFSRSVSVKMAKRADLGLKYGVLYKLVHFAENR